MTEARRRPPFAQVPREGDESVWDYPRPPRIAADTRLVQVDVGTLTIASSRRSVRVLETASPPTFYIPPDDVRLDLLERTSGATLCEWKGTATYFDVVFPDRRIERAAWSYFAPTHPFAAIASWLAFYPSRVDCRVDEEPVRPQAGGFYGGWTTSEIVGPFKGDPGTEGW